MTRYKTIVSKLSKFDVLQPLLWRLHVSKKFPETLNNNKQTNKNSSQVDCDVFLFKLVTQYHGANLNQIWYEASVGEGEHKINYSTFKGVNLRQNWKNKANYSN